MQALRTISRFALRTSEVRLVSSASGGSMQKMNSSKVKDADVFMTNDVETEVRDSENLKKVAQDMEKSAIRGPLEGSAQSLDAESPTKKSGTATHNFSSYKEGDKDKVSELEQNLMEKESDKLNFQPNLKSKPDLAKAKSNTKL